jgi:hypothetical protein
VIRITFSPSRIWANTEVLDRHALISHVARHAHVLPNATGRGTLADGAISAVHHRTMRLRLAVHAVLFHDTLEAFAFRLANHVDEIALRRTGLR